MYTVLIKKEASKKLHSLSGKERTRITEKIVMLGRNPDDHTLDIKQLHGQSCYRLRVGDWRIMYDRDDYVKIISIEKIKSRGDAYK